jgi:hypothetical protein
LKERKFSLNLATNPFPHGSFSKPGETGFRFDTLPCMEVKDDLQLTFTVIGMFFGPWLAVRLSLRQFRSQKWWERQQEAYTTLLESLSVILNFYETHFDALIHGEGWRPGSDVFQRLKDARYQLEKYSAIGAYLISDEASEALRLYHRKTYRADEGCDEDKYFQILSSEAAKCIHVLKAEAKKELKTAR